LERKFSEELKEWEDTLAKTRSQIVQLTETVIRSANNIQPAVIDSVYRLISFCVEQSCRFTQFLFAMLGMSPALKNNPVAQTVIRHIIRESEYFIGITQTICAQT
jgi:hypothetical protein